MNKKSLKIVPVNGDCSEGPGLRFVRGKLHHRLGEFPQAIEYYERAIQLGSNEAEQSLLLIRFDAAIASTGVTTIEAGQLREVVDPNLPSTLIRLAELFRLGGWHGRALATLEVANERFPRDAAIQRPLAELYRSFSRPDLAAALYECILEAIPDDKAAKTALLSAKSAMMTPLMGNAHHAD